MEAGKQGSGAKMAEKSGVLKESPGFDSRLRCSLRFVFSPRLCDSVVSRLIFSHF
jgi:hypothetical protein